VGRLHLRHRGVYAVGHVPPSPHARAMAAVLACWPGAFLSYLSGGALWAMGIRWGPIIDVTAATKHRHKGIRVHRSRTLTAREVTVHFGIPVTTPARTLLDLADVLDTPLPHPRRQRGATQAPLHPPRAARAPGPLAGPRHPPAPALRGARDGSHAVAARG
jgi:hypothetical protein